MLNVSHKIRTKRTAIAQAELRLSAESLQRVRERSVPKGDALEVARVAAIQAAKDTSRIIPFCHPLPIDYVAVDYELGDRTIVVRTTVTAIYKTGVEMEALTAASVAALTLYDMLKMLDESMEIVGIRLVEKHGGKSDFRDEHDTPPRAAVLVVSDRVAHGEKLDRSGRLLEERLKQHGVSVEDYRVVADEPHSIEQTLVEYADTMRLDLVLTTGGTGLSRRDTTPEATSRVIDRSAPGISEAIRGYGQERLPSAMLSRGVAGLRGDTLIVNLPGSAGAVTDALNAVFPAVLHCLAMRRGGKHRDSYGEAESDGSV